MIRSSYLAPTEHPTLAIDVKRALLTYDRVYISDPNDRDLIPPQSFMTAAFGMPPFMGLNSGPVRPLGKSPNFDNEFERLLDDLKLARREGLIEVVSSYDLSTTSQTTLGAVLMGDYPLNPSFMLSAFRTIAREDSVLEAAVQGDQRFDGLTEEEVAALAVEGARADGGLNDDPQLPLLASLLSNENLRAPLTLIARGRVAAVMKTIGFCAAKEMVPIFSEPNYNALVSLFSRRATNVIDVIGQQDPYWAKRSRALDIAHDEYLDEVVLAEMSVDDVISLRTGVWGKQAEARDELLASVAELAREADQTADFDGEVRERIQSYRAIAVELADQRSSLSFTVKCELAKATGAGALLAGNAVPGLLAQMQTAMGAGTLLVAGCLWAVDKIQDFKPTIDNLRSVEAEFSDNICLGLHNFYRRIAEAVGSDAKL